MYGKSCEITKLYTKKKKKLIDEMERVRVRVTCWVTLATAQIKWLHKKGQGYFLTIYFYFT